MFFMGGLIYSAFYFLAILMNKFNVVETILNYGLTGIMYILLFMLFLLLLIVVYYMGDDIIDYVINKINKRKECKNE